MGWGVGWRFLSEGSIFKHDKTFETGTFLLVVGVSAPTLPRCSVGHVGWCSWVQLGAALTKWRQQLLLTRRGARQLNTIKKKTKVQPHPLWSHCAGQRVDGNMWCMWELLHKVSLESSTQTRPTFWDQSSAPTLCGGRSRNARLAACGPWWGLFHWMNRSRNDTAAYLAARTRCILRSTNRRCSCSCGSIFCCCCLSFVGVGDTREGAGGAVFADVVLNSSHHHGVSLLSLFFFPGTSVKASHLETTFAAQSEVAVSHWGQISAPSLAPPLTETQQACDL